MSKPIEQRKSQMPEANKMARMLRSGRTTEDLALRYGVNSYVVEQQLTLHGWDVRSGKSVADHQPKDYARRTPALSARGDGPGQTCHFVGGGDNPNVVPTVARPYRPQPHPTGIVWPVSDTAWVVPAAPKPRRSSPRTRKISVAQETEMAARYLDGESSVDLARVFDVNERTIRTRLRNLGVPLRTRSEALRLRHSQRLRAITTVELPSQDVA